MGAPVTGRRGPGRTLPPRPPLGAVTAAGFDELVASGGAPLAGPVLPPGAQVLLSSWVAARDHGSIADRLALLEIPLLAALDGSVTKACAAAREIADAEGDSGGVAAVERVRDAALEVAGWDTGRRGVAALHYAWDAGAACPLGRGLPPLGAVRPDLPLQGGYRALAPEARLVLLAVAAEIGHQRLLVHASVVAQRAGLAVADVRLALTARRWFLRHSRLAPRVVSATPALFLGLRDGPWGARRRPFA